MGNAGRMFVAGVSGSSDRRSGVQTGKVVLHRLDRDVVSVGGEAEFLASVEATLLCPDGDGWSAPAWVLDRDGSLFRRVRDRRLEMGLKVRVADLGGVLSEDELEGAEAVDSLHDAARLAEGDLWLTGSAPHVSGRFGDLLGRAVVRTGLLAVASEASMPDMATWPLRRQVLHWFHAVRLVNAKVLFLGKGGFPAMPHLLAHRVPDVATAEWVSEMAGKTLRGMTAVPKLPVAGLMDAGGFVPADTGLLAEVLHPVDPARRPEHAGIRGGTDGGPRGRGRPRRLAASQVEAARRLLDAGAKVPETAMAMGVSVPTLYRALASDT